MVFGLSMNLLNYFVSIGGYEAITEFFVAGNQRSPPEQKTGNELIPLEFIFDVTDAFTNMQHVMTTEFVT